MDKQLTNIDRTAPVISQRSRRIQAPLTVLWRLHINVPMWPEWQHDIESATLHGKFIVGSSFTWKTAGIVEPITSTIYVIENERRTVWQGTAAGITAIHEWKFTAERGGTLVETQESWAGEPVMKDKDQLAHALDQSLDRWLGYFAQEMSHRRAA
ncbi:MAG: hypothetical protein QM831_38005 [Kofleriaceae bacterium]